MKTKIIVAILMVLLIGAGGAVGYIYLDDWKKSVEKEKYYLQGKVANLYKENKDLRKQVAGLSIKNKKIAKEVNFQNQVSQSMKKIKGDADAKLIADLVWESLKEQGNYANFKDVTVKKTATWATANAIAKDTAKNENLLFVFKKRSGQWDLLNFGNSLSKSDYAGSPYSIWK